MPKTTWEPPKTETGKLSDKEQGTLPSSAFAFPRERKEPLTSASHVRDALARFDQVRDVSDGERDEAFANIRKAARYYDVDVRETDWHELGKRPHTRDPSRR